MLLAQECIEVIFTRGKIAGSGGEKLFFQVRGILDAGGRRFTSQFRQFSLKLREAGCYCRQQPLKESRAHPGLLQGQFAPDRRDLRGLQVASPFGQHPGHLSHPPGEALQPLLQGGKLLDDQGENTFHDLEQVAGRVAQMGGLLFVFQDKLLQQLDDEGVVDAAFPAPAGRIGLLQIRQALPDPLMPRFDCRDAAIGQQMIVFMYAHVCRQNRRLLQEPPDHLIH